MIRERIVLARRVYQAADLGCVAASFLAAHAIRGLWDGETLQAAGLRIGPFEHLAPLGRVSWILLFALPLYGASFSLHGLYRSHRGRSLSWLLGRILRACAIALGLLLVVLYLLHAVYYPRSFFVLFGILAPSLVTLERAAVLALLLALRRRGRNLRFALVAGTGACARRIQERIERTQAQGLTLVGFLDEDPARKGARVAGTEILGSAADLEGILHGRVVDEVFYTLPLSEAHEATLLACFDACRRLGVGFRVVPDLFPEGEAVSVRPSVDEFLGVPLLSFSSVPAHPVLFLLKGAFDLAASAVLLLALSPLLVVVTALVKATSPGPVLFRQRRAGLNGREFELFKFRTMVAGADAMRDDLLDHNEMSGPVFKIRDDPRVTRIGRFLRVTSLDELPQLLNVVRGEMSLVGPRPLPVYEARKITGSKRRRLSMRPGITCFWQISGRNEIDFDRWMEMDLEYIDAWSPWLDLKILLKTIPAVLKRRGAS